MGEGVDVSVRVVVLLAACGGSSSSIDAAPADADPDSFNMLPPMDAPLPTCLADMFAGTTLDTAKWAMPTMRPSIAVAQNDGLRFAYADDGGTGVSVVSGVRSVEAVDMENKPLRVQIAQVPTLNNTLLRAELRTGNLALFKIEVVRDATGATTLACYAGANVIYSGAPAAYAQLRFTTEEVFCETSADGAAFVTRGMRTAFAPVSVELGLVATVAGMVTGTGTAAIRQVTTCPN